MLGMISIISWPYQALLCLRMHIWGFHVVVVSSYVFLLFSTQYRIIIFLVLTSSDTLQFLEVSPLWFKVLMSTTITSMRDLMTR